VHRSGHPIAARRAALLAAVMLAGGCPAVALAASAGGPVKGARYAGYIGPGYPMSFRVSANGDAVVDLVVAFDETCSAGAGNTAPKFDYGTLAIKHGGFSGNTIDHFGTTVSDSLRITGHFSSREATGKVTDLATIKSLGSCTQSEPFIAKVK
jgi:hypothetical protein